MMSEYEIELFNMLYENDDPGEAVLTAIKVFAAFLEQPGVVPALQPDGSQESA